MSIPTQTSTDAPLDCVASVVVYNNSLPMIESAVRSFLDTKLRVKLYIIDNSPAPLPASFLDKLPVAYHHVGRNLGYGKAHNRCMEQCEPCQYYLVLNPDVIISRGTIEELMGYMEKHPQVGIICPKILNEDHTLQCLNKQPPNVLDLCLRRICFKTGASSWVKKRLDRYVMKHIGYDHICDVPYMTGAFMFCRFEALKQVGGFDPRFFLYFEDADLSRKMQQAGYRTVFYPHVNITHFWQRASHHSFKMSVVLVMNGFRYFQKWGWKLY